MSAFAQSTVESADSFKTVQKLIAQDKHPKHLLIALDDDDTLTMVPCYPYSVGTKSSTSCQYLGGPAWFSWEASLSKNNPDRIWKKFSQLLSINYLLLTIDKMPLDDSSIPSALNTAAKRGAKVVVATARDYFDLDATENQLQQDGILNVIEKCAIRTPTDHTSYPGYYFPNSWNKHKSRLIAYVHGVLYLAGQNKGEMIKQFLAKTHQRKNIHEIIFVDDTLQNVIDVANTYKNNPHVHVISIHYLRLAKHKLAFTHGKNAKIFQAVAMSQWKNIKDAIYFNHKA